MSWFKRVVKKPVFILAVILPVTLIAEFVGNLDWAGLSDMEPYSS